MENTNTSEIIFNDDFFTSYARTIKEELDRKPGSGGFTREYESVEYAGVEKGKNKIFRFLGIPPKANVTRRNWDPKEVVMSDVKADDGKRFTLRLPPREDDKSRNHIVHRIYDRINEVIWINKQKTYVNQAKFPDLFERSNKMGFTPEDGDISYKQASGLKGSKYIIYNVIDRHDSWCKDNKHTKILANSVNVDDKGRVWGKPGIKEFGFITKLADLISKYKLPEDYDIAIKRIAGAMTEPWELKNASLYASKDLMEELKNDDGTLPDKNIIVIGPLSAEEKAYEKYDLDKFYGPTSYQTILKRIGGIFKATDADLKTKFYDELLSLVEDEKKRYEAIYRDAEKDTATNEVETLKEIANGAVQAPSRRTVVGPIPTGLSQEKIAKLLGWSKLTDDQKSLITDVVLDSEGNVKDLKWLSCPETENLLACDGCGIASPDQFSSCPCCAASFV
jgi:rubrerythrin